jgi:sorbitol/mannitol transport system substrate-binding protein
MMKQWSDEGHALLHSSGLDLDMKIADALLIVSMISIGGTDAMAERLTIATVNNGDMIRMQELAGDFSATYPEIELQWVTLDESTLRRQVTSDVASGGGHYDVMTIGTYEVPIWGRQGWLVSLEDLPASYDVDDFLPAIRDGLTVDGKLYAAPFYGESSMVMYRTDLMEKAGLKMPEAPDWAFIREAARAMTDRAAGINGICLRGKPGWGENVAFITATSNSFGAKWFDMEWTAQFNSPEWKETLTFYIDLLNESGPPDAAQNGFNENLTLFQNGNCAIWIDATVAASFITNPSTSRVADSVGFALAPDNGLGKRSNWLWAWALAIPVGTKNADAAKKFVQWATSRQYQELVAETEGWANVPPGTRKSLYENPEYAKLPFARMTLESIEGSDPLQPATDEVPYVGIQFVSIPEFQRIATAVGQQFSAALAGTLSIEDALDNAQALTTREMRRAGYPK